MSFQLRCSLNHRRKSPPHTSKELNAPQIFVIPKKPLSKKTKKKIRSAQIK